MGEETFRGEEGTFREEKGGKGKGKGKGKGTGKGTGGFIKKLGALQAAEFFFPNWEKIFLQLEKSISDFELKSDAGRMADRSWEEPFISEE